jgi:hypothetical protein
MRADWAFVARYTPEAGRKARPRAG